MKKKYYEVGPATVENPKGGFVALVECDFLQKYASNKICLELGSYTGMSTVALAEVAKEVTSIDTFKACTNGQHQVENFTTLNVFKENTEGWENIIVKIGKNTDIIPTLQDGYFDLVFLDAMHDVRSVEEDLICIWPKMKIGGMLMFHDYGWDAFFHDGGPKVVIDKYFDSFVDSMNSIVCVIKKDEVLKPLEGKENSIAVPTKEESMGRYMCLGCGRFWKAEKKMMKGCVVSFCPYCCDVFYGDNVIEDVPLPLFPYFTVETCCGTIMLDTPSDFKYCCSCGKRIEVDLPEGQGIVDWQTKELERINI